MDSSSTPRKEKKGLGRLWTKVKLAIKSKSKTKPAAGTIQDSSTQPPRLEDSQRSIQPQPQTPTQHSMEPLPPMATAANPQAPTAPVMQATEAQPTAHDDGPVVEPAAQPAIDAGASPERKEELARRYERAQAIFKKYDLELDDSTWDMHPRPQAERVLKQPRMRVRWTCHECKTTFGHDKICVECAHQRCRSCVRYPPKKRKARAARVAAAAAALDQPATMEVHDGACHECQTAFSIGSQECSNCHHQICERCLQETLVAAEQAEAQASVTA